jgi:hypothetical protein
MRRTFAVLAVGIAFRRAHHERAGRDDDHHRAAIRTVLELPAHSLLCGGASIGNARSDKTKQGDPHFMCRWHAALRGSNSIDTIIYP